MDRRSGRDRRSAESIAHRAMLREIERRKNEAVRAAYRKWIGPAPSGPERAAENEEEDARVEALARDWGLL